MELELLKKKMDEANYVYDDTLAVTLSVALQLGRPLLIEGAAGVGKTEVAKVMAKALDRDFVRLQCYEGLDEGKMEGKKAMLETKLESLPLLFLLTA